MSYVKQLRRHTQGVMIAFSLLYMIPDAVIYAASIAISWNDNQETDLSGYKVYYGTAAGSYGSPIDVGNITAYELSGLTAGARYFISLTAYDTSANESDHSVEISGIAQSLTTITSTLPASTSSTSTTSSVPSSTSTAPALSTTTVPSVTTRPSSTSTTTSPPTTTTAIVLTTTTTIPVTSTQPSSSTSSTPAESTTTTTAGEETASCEEPTRLQPIAVTDSTYERFFFPITNIVDGDPQTSWATIFTLFKRDASIVLDLGSEKTITELSLYASRLFGIDFLPTTLELQISNDNATWHTITAAAETMDRDTATGDNWQLRGHTCRYIKLCLGGRKSLFLLQLAQIAELELYGCDSGSHPPFSARGGSSASETNDAATGLNQPSPAAGRTDEQLTPGVPGRPVVSFQ